MPSKTILVSSAPPSPIVKVGVVPNKDKLPLAVIKLDAEIVVKAPVLAAFAPIAVPSIAPPLISTVLSVVVDKGRVIQALLALFLSLIKYL